eukprot:gnl/MRDRNA2_/MRDRNA2_63176_c0_seq1.p1 gnl/MRDRNA2_/MRDRNA2_63176_c0~~gnl/MRDRNA2_/MRDRNA2_63176_c0_seq1.p1  ORF type:complete len:114 (-),score=9.18 gnl/MRDRNA2_/MRDRNA2_63176_c0_seq1:64-405(-)
MAERAIVSYRDTPAVIARNANAQDVFAKFCGSTTPRAVCTIPDLALVMLTSTTPNMASAQSVLERPKGPHYRTPVQGVNCNTCGSNYAPNFKTQKFCIKLLNDYTLDPLKAAL